MTGFHLQSDPKLKHTFPNSQTSWKTDNNYLEELKEEEEKKLEKVEKDEKEEVFHKSKQDNQTEGTQSGGVKEMEEQSIFPIHSSLNSTLTNFGDALHKTERKG